MCRKQRDLEIETIRRIDSTRIQFKVRSTDLRKCRRVDTFRSETSMREQEGYDTYRRCASLGGQACLLLNTNKAQKHSVRNASNLCDRRTPYDLVRRLARGNFDIPMSSRAQQLPRRRSVQGIATHSCGCADTRRGCSPSRLYVVFNACERAREACKGLRVCDHCPPPSAERDRDSPFVSAGVWIVRAPSPSFPARRNLGIKSTDSNGREISLYFRIER